MPRTKTSKTAHRRLRCETLEPRFLLSSNAPFNPVLDLQVDAGVTYAPSTGEISAWSDQGANDNDLFSSGSARPTFATVQTPTGLDAIRFDGVDDRLVRDLNDPGGISGPPVNDKDRTMFLVAQFHDATTVGGAAYGRGALNQAFGLGVGGPGAEHGQLAVQGWAQNNDFYFEEEGFSSPGNSTGWQVLSLVHERNGTNPADNNWLYSNGNQVAAWSHNFNTKLHSTLNVNGNTASRLVLGEGIKGTGYIQMDVAAWLVYDEVLSTTDRATVESFLTATYLNAGANTAPTAADDYVEIAAGSTVTIHILANDTDPDSPIDPASVNIITPPSQASSFSVDPQTGIVSYTHNGSTFNDSFTYTITDNAGATSDAANVAIVVSPDVLPVMAGLVTHLETDSGLALDNGSRVASWTDNSNTGLQLTSSGDPQLVPGATPSGKPAIVFDGAGDTLEIGGATALLDLPDGSEDRTVFVVANYVDNQGAQSGFAYGKPNHNRTFGVGADAGTGRLAVQGFNAANDLVSSTPGEGAGWKLQSVVLENNNLEHYENGALIDAWTHTYATRLNTSDARMVLGQSINQTGYSELEIGAVLVYDRALSATERLQLESYLRGKYLLGGGGNLAPTATDDSYSTVVGGVINTATTGLPTVLANDTDPNSDPLSALLVSQPTHGSVTLNLDGHFVYQHDGSASTTDSFTYRANDGTDDSNTATVQITIDPGTGSGVNSLIVRWHGDYYHHLWDSAYPGGTPRDQLENRWLRGGPPQGAQNSQQNLDLDNDGQMDDSRVWFDFSLTTPLNPPGTPQKPNGVFYHTDMPSAQFYGGLSAEFLNYETDRIQQAFIENDGAGGELDDVGYPSPYLTPEYQGQADFIESVRHADGRPKKSHVGPHEDFAINLYRPDLPHPLNPSDNPADNLVTFHAAFLWRKADFLEHGNTAQVSLDQDSSFSFESTRWWDNVGSARWILQSVSGQLYISQFTSAGAQDNWGTTNTFANPLGSNWAVYNPATNDLDFNAATATWIDPVANNLFGDIQAVGVYVENDTPSGALTKFSLDEIRVNAVVGTSNLTAAGVTPPTDSPTEAVIAPVFSLNHLTPSSTATKLETGISEVPILEASPVARLAIQQTIASSTEQATAVSALDSTSGEKELATDWQSLDEAFADWLAG